MRVQTIRVQYRAQMTVFRDLPEHWGSHRPNAFTSGEGEIAVNGSGFRLPDSKDSLVPTYPPKVDDHVRGLKEAAHFWRLVHQRTAV